MNDIGFWNNIGLCWSCQHKYTCPEFYKPNALISYCRNYKRIVYNIEKSNIIRHTGGKSNV